MYVNKNLTDLIDVSAKLDNLISKIISLKIIVSY